MAIPVPYTTATLQQHVGHDFGLSAAVPLDQPRIDHFAECTGDHQWIHVDIERARTQSPLGGTIAHGLLSLSLIPAAHYGLGVYPPAAQAYAAERLAEVDTPEAFEQGATANEGTWWPHLAQWLATRSAADKRAPRRTGSRAYPALDAAPGRYVTRAD